MSSKFKSCNFVFVFRFGSWPQVFISPSIFAFSAANEMKEKRWRKQKLEVQLEVFGRGKMIEFRFGEFCCPEFLVQISSLFHRSWDISTPDVANGVRRRGSSADLHIGRREIRSLDCNRSLHHCCLFFQMGTLEVGVSELVSWPFREHAPPLTWILKNGAIDIPGSRSRKKFSKTVSWQVPKNSLLGQQTVQIQRFSPSRVFLRNLFVDSRHSPSLNYIQLHMRDLIPLASRGSTR